ncbi:hypothetical protein C8J57DRAFT_1248916 [Mycena rebaudengoi]|nr:hypothetical protein C8J57DRAFT_1248916 [Mycena rebaudengoi]
MHCYSPSLTATGSISSLALCLHLCHTNGDPGASTFTLRVEVDEESRGRNGADGRKEKDKTLGPVPADVRVQGHLIHTGVKGIQSESFPENDSSVASEPGSLNDHVTCVEFPHTGNVRRLAW